ncbi:uncharacterized protein LOC141668130 [Apium graveolens]|uniref:uncharacterized protein LOC141668130 n=1 Tax=Apium graveolens TaxID=4045 RepID=UPI003D7A5D3C
MNGTQYNKWYYLADDIYPEWSTFVKTIPLPQGDKRNLYSLHQEAVHKDVERALGVLQSSFSIVRGPSRFWRRDILKDIMYACAILHSINYDVVSDTPTIEVMHGPVGDFSTMLKINSEI